jgi:hypothetical protein
VQKKEEITAFIAGSDITSWYQTLSGVSESGLMRVSIKSPLNTWSLQLPRTLKLLELWELSFRLTKGRYMRFELQHKNAPLPPSQDTIESAVNAGHTVFLTPLDTAPVADQDTPTEELYLVKLYAESYARPLTSYWEPKKTTRSLGSALFRYYRHKFMMEPTTRIEGLRAFYHNIHSVGDWSRGFNRWRTMGVSVLVLQWRKRNRHTDWRIDDW